MSRGGRGGGGGRQKNQPDFSWDDEEAPAVPSAHRPPPTFPRLDLPVPRPLDAWESASVKAYLSFRTRCHNNSPFYSTLDPSTQTDDKGRVDKRAGVDPFHDQDVYSKRFERRKRTEPDLSGRRDGYALQFFPKELWPLLDPKHKHPLWTTLDAGDKLKAEAAAAAAAKKRKRTKPVVATSDDDDDYNDDEQQQDGGGGNDSDDGAAAAARKRKRDAAAAAPAPAPAPAAGAASARGTGQKRGLDAEDDYPEDQNDDEEGGEEDDEPQDSEYDEDDEDMNDYNAEQYFDDGDDADLGDDGGGDGDDGGTY